MSNRQAKPKAESKETESTRSRTPEKAQRQEIRQRSRKPLKLDVTGVQEAIEEERGAQIKMKWVRHTAIPYHQKIAWSVVSSDLRSQINPYTPDGRLKPRGENIQDASGGAFTAAVGGGEVHFLMWKDLNLYNAEDAVWNKEEADRPMDSIQSAAESGERAGLDGDVKAYQPKQQVKLNKQRDMY